MNSRINVQVESDCIVAEIMGKVAEGSDGNSTTAAWRIYIREKLLEMGKESSRAIIFDLRKLEYEFGDSIAGLWIDAMRRKTPFVVLAQGSTFAALKSLIAYSNLPIPLVKTMEEARQTINQSPRT